LARRQGATDAQLEAVQVPPFDGFEPAWQVALEVADHMTHDAGRVPPDAYARLEAAWSPAQVVEIVGVISAFAMFNRFANALEIPPTR
jgi:alkylhydroperoxidase family enzyme